MEIIAHRGEWTDPVRPAAANSLESFKLALEHGFGAEIDIRDYEGELVISHNPAGENSPKLDDLLAYYTRLGSASVLAFNIKADGLQPVLLRALKEHGISRYFTFDLSIPNTVVDKKEGVRYFLRQSEYEREPALLEDLYDSAAGIWVDQFRQDGAVLQHNLGSIAGHISAGKQVCWVSAELHPWGKDPQVYRAVWQELAHITAGLKAGEGSLLLCTDFPAQAKEFFNDKH